MEGLRRNIYGHSNLDLMSPADVKSNFRFNGEDILRLRDALRLPAEIRTDTRNVVTSTEGLCILLRRLVYPNRLKDLEKIFGLSQQSLSQITKQVANIILNNFNNLLCDLDNVVWLTRNKLETYSQAICHKGSPIGNFGGFIDGTSREICRPSVHQEQYYSGHKRMHCVKYQTILTRDGLTVNLSGAYPVRYHDAAVFRESNTYEQLERKAVFENKHYVLYGDQGYGIKELLLVPYANPITQEQQNFNTAMSGLRVSVEWGFQKVCSEFGFIDFRKNQKLLLQDVEQFYKS